MTIQQIYAAFTPGSKGFVKAVEAHCGYCASSTEIERIAAKTTDAAEFQTVWENDDSWTDANNSDDA